METDKILIKFQDTNEFVKHNFDTYRTVQCICKTRGLDASAVNIDNLSVKLENEFKEAIMKHNSQEKDELERILAEIDVTNEFDEDSDDLASENGEHANDYDDDEDEDKNATSTDTYQTIDEASTVLSSTLEDTFNKQIQNTRNSWLTLPLIAARTNRLDVIKSCCVPGFKLSDFRNGLGSTVMHEVLSTPDFNVELFKFLIKHVDINIMNDSGQTVLAQCALRTDISPSLKLEMIETLFNYGARHDIIDTTKRSLPVLSAYLSSLTSTEDPGSLTFWKEIIDVLVKAGVDTNTKDWLQQTPLIMAINNVPTSEYTNDMDTAHLLDGLQSTRKSKIGIVKYLLQNGSDANIKDSSGRTAVHAAVNSQNNDVLEIVIQHGGDPQALTNMNLSPAYDLCMSSDWAVEDDVRNTFLPILKTLVTAGLDLNAVALDGTTILHFAAVKWGVNLVGPLIELGGDIHAVDYLHRTPLHMASRNCDDQVAKLFLKCGSKIDARDIHNESPLHHACLWDNVGVVRLLIEHRVDVNTIADRQIQPIHLAAENSDDEMIRLLVEASANIEAEDVDKATPLHYAAADGNPESMECLLLLGANKAKVDLSGRTPLDHALLRGHYKVSTILADSDQDVRFGKLPEGIFPNRPLVKFEHVDKYYQETSEKYKRYFCSEDRFARGILDTVGLGKCDLETEESQQISNAVVSIVQHVIDHIGKIEPLFKASLIHAGSAFEKVKVGYPDEFDFLCQLDNISDHIDSIEATGTNEFTKILMKASFQRDYSKYTLRSGKHINAAGILRHFYKLFHQALFHVYNKRQSQIYCGCSLISNLSPIYGEESFMNKKLFGFSLSWRGRQFKLLDISVDLNPVIFTKIWPEDAVKTCSLIPDISDHGIYLIPKHCDIISLPTEPFPVSSDLWRYSTHHLEALVLQRMPQIGRDCYMICKAFRMEPISCSIEFELNVTWHDPTRLQELNDSDAEDFNQALINIGGTLEEDDEITAESEIPSYFLKCIFLKEALDLLEHRDFEEADLYRIPRKVYEQLLQCIQTHSLTSVFFPTYNIYSTPSTRENHLAQAREQYCKNILGVMQQMNF